MHVVEHHDHGTAFGQVAQHSGQAVEQAQPRRLPLRRRATHGRDAVQHRGEVIEESATQIQDLVGIESGQVALESLRPQPEGGRFAEGKGPGEKGEDVGTGYELVHQAGLARPGLAQHQDNRSPEAARASSSSRTASSRSLPTSLGPLAAAGGSD